MKNFPTFNKYPSLTNHYAMKKRAWENFVNKEFYATEKIHGSNMSITMTKDGQFKVASRSQYIYDGDLYNKIINSVSKETLDILKDIFNEIPNITHIQLFGEVYGAGVQKMQYEECLKNIQNSRFFDIFLFKEDEILIPGLDFLQKHFPEHLLVPMFMKGTLKDLISQELPKESKLGGNQEGLVYKPLFPYTMSILSDNRFYPVIKHKHEEFGEVKQKIKTPKVILARELELDEDINRYFTRNRLLNVLSKGIELSMQNIKHILPVYLKDVKEEYLKENTLNATEEEVNKIIGNKAKLVVELIKEELAKEMEDL